jgi:hypothetical protein
VPLLYAILTLLLLTPALRSHAQGSSSSSSTGPGSVSGGISDSGGDGIGNDTAALLSSSGGSFFNDSDSGIGDNSTDLSSTGVSDEELSGGSGGSGGSTGGAASSSTGPKPDIIPPGGSIGNGASSFGSTDAVFLTTVFGRCTRHAHVHAHFAQLGGARLIDAHFAHSHLGYLRCCACLLCPLCPAALQTCGSA